MFDTAFTVETELTVEQLLDSKKGRQILLNALENRLIYLRNNLSECGEAFGHNDTYEI